jgi:integrase
MADLSRKRERERLKPRREPYWQRLDKGMYLGFRRAKVYARSTWHARLRGRDGKQNYHALPAVDVDDYDGAKKAAEKWLKQMGVAPSRRKARGTVREALEYYLQYLRNQGRDNTARTIERKFKQVVWDDPLASIPTHALIDDDSEDWRDRLREGRQPRSINRIVRDYKAGMNVARKKGKYVIDPRAYDLEPLADDVEGTGEAAVFLEPHHRKQLINKALPAAAEFMRGLELTGARPGELAAATVADLGTKHGTLQLKHRKGRKAKIKIRSVVLSRDGLVFFKKQAKNKLPGTRLFLDPDGRPWQRKRWAEEIRAASAIVNARVKGKNRIPTGATAYSFRHARISELLQEYKIDPLTVAMQTGTSIKMIELYYFNLIVPALRDKLAAVDEG